MLPPRRFRIEMLEQKRCAMPDQSHMERFIQDRGAEVVEEAGDGRASQSLRLSERYANDHAQFSHVGRDFANPNPEPPCPLTPSIALTS